ncbi:MULTISPECIES: PH domain-containing protein [unclassified Streptomyces]|uniref:PH domain-containing protein n=1 Tax=unclassified Streptomyces TaxID=2593676 RepID=UPI003828F143
MTSPAEQPPAEPTYADRVYRSASGIMGGALLLAIVLWLGGDALFRGEGSTPWLALAGLLFAVPLVVAFTLRPAVFAGADQLRIRNPFRTIVLPWASVKDVRATFSVEAFTEDSGKFQLWAVPVSLRQRKRANRRTGGGDRAEVSQLAQADRTVAELRDLSERSSTRPSAQGEPVVRWAYEVIAPAAAGLVVLIVLLVVG